VHEYGRYLEAIDKIDKIGLTVKSPNGYEIPNPSISIANTALANALKLGSAFGMNPIARTKINVDEKKVETNPIIKLAKAANV
jgi:P27 family predicted phage terminase small subunit